jgi:NitT/TauT family transport system substrate-binding protein
MDTTRRRFLHAAAGGVAAVGTLGRGRVAHAQETTVKVGCAVLGDYAMVTPILVAIDKGFFKAQGLNAEFQPFRGGPDLVKAVLGGQIHVGVSGATDIPVFRAEGAPIRYVATQVDGNHFTFNVAPGISSVAEIKGKSIGVTRIGATTWIFAAMLARKQGWDPDRDVKIVGLGGLDAQIAALSRGEIHGYVWGDGGAVMELQGKSRVLFRFDTITPKWISQSYYSSDDTIKGSREVVAKTLKALFRAAQLIRDSPKEVYPIAAKTLKWPEDAVARAHAISGALLSKDGVINVEAIDAMQATLLEYKAQKQRVSAADLYTKDFTPVRG